MSIENGVRIWAQMKNGNNVTGDIVIEPDGSFSGKFTDESTIKVLTELLSSGFADSVMLRANTTPAISSVVFYGPKLPTDIEVINTSSKFAYRIAGCSISSDIDGIRRVSREWEKFLSILDEEKHRLATTCYAINRERATKRLENGFPIKIGDELLWKEN